MKIIYLFLSIYIIIFCISNSKLEANHKKFRNEEEYLIVNTLSYLTKLINGEEAKSIKVEAQKLDYPSYIIEVEISEKKIQSELNFKDYIFDPSVYQSFILKLLGESNTEISNILSIDILHDCLSLSVENIQEINFNLSDSLKYNKFNLCLHADIALLLGIYSWKEAAGTFYDIRDTLCKLSAHLAIASSKGLKYDNLEFAEILLQVLIGREVAATKMIESWQNKDKSNSQLVWLDAIKARNSYSWKAINYSEDSSLLEKLEYFRAQLLRLGQDNAFNQNSHMFPGTNLNNPQNLNPDFIRVFTNYVRQTGQPSVHSGHYINRFAIVSELKDIQKIYKPSSSERTQVQEVNALFSSNDQNLRKLVTTIQQLKSKSNDNVISNKMWSNYYQRHLLNHCKIILNFQRFSWGVPELSRESSIMMLEELKELNLFPITKTYFIPNRADDSSGYSAEDKQAGVDAVKEVKEFLQNSDKLNVTARAWFDSHYRFEKKVKLSQLKVWFNRPYPYGTIYNCFNRFINPRFHNRYKKVFNNYVAIFPNNPWFSNDKLCFNSSSINSLEDANQIFGPMFNEDIYAARFVASNLILSGNEEEAIYLYENMPSYDLMSLYTLARIHFLRGHTDKAIKLYQEFFDRDSNPVQKAHYSQALMRLHYKKGNIEKAREIANYAANVYSYNGLLTKSELLILEGNIKEAMEYIRRIEERYNTFFELSAYYHRFHKIYKFDEATKEKYENDMNNIFPNGMQKIQLNDLPKSGPSKGMYFKNTNHIIIKLSPLRAVDGIIVGIDGYKIENQSQYTFIKSLNPDGPLNITVWQDGEYQVMNINLFQRIFDCKSFDYVKE